MDILQKVAVALKKENEKTIFGKPVEAKHFGGFISDRIKMKHDNLTYVFFEIRPPLEAKSPSKIKWVEMSELMFYERDALITFILGIHDFELLDMLIKVGLLKVQNGIIVRC